MGQVPVRRTRKNVRNGDVTDNVHLHEETAKEYERAAANQHDETSKQQERARVQGSMRRLRGPSSSSLPPPSQMHTSRTYETRRSHTVHNTVTIIASLCALT